MAKYEIPIGWECFKRYTVEAENLEEAVIKAAKQFLSEPDENYLDDSFSIDETINEEYPDETYSMSNVFRNLP
jgi:hypothetical protein